MMHAPDSQVDTDLGFVALSTTPVEWKVIISAIQTIVEDATFDVTSEGICFRAMDPSHVALVDIFWPKENFERFHCSRPNNFTVRVEDFAKLIRRCEAKDQVEVSKRGEGALELRIGNVRYKKEFELHLLNTRVKSSPLPKLSFSVRFAAQISFIRQVLDDISTVSSHISVHARSDMVVFSGKGDAGTAESVLGLEQQSVQVLEIITDSSEARATYGIEYIANVVKALASSAGIVKFEFSSKMPMRLEFLLGEGQSKTRIRFYLAPRVTS